MPATALLTSEQYLALPDEFDKSGNHIKDELIAGEIVRMSPPWLVHDLIKNRINKILVHLEKMGVRALIGMGAQVAEYDTFVPDVCVVSRNRLSTDDRIFGGAPEIAIEVVSPEDQEVHLKHKIAAYLANGATTVWVVYPDDRSVMVHTAGSMRELKADQIIEDPLLPGFSTPVSAFFELT
jgi:Uma2 family endonuclease